MWIFFLNGLNVSQMPEVAAVRISWFIFLCPVLLSFSRPPVKNGEAEPYLFLEPWVAGWKQHKECRGWISQILCQRKNKHKNSPFFFLLKWKLSSNSNRGFPGVETPGYNFVFLLKDQHPTLWHRFKPRNMSRMMKTACVSSLWHFPYLVYSRGRIKLKYLGVIWVCSEMYDSVYK